MFGYFRNNFLYPLNLWPFRWTHNPKRMELSVIYVYAISVARFRFGTTFWSVLVIIAVAVADKRGEFFIFDLRNLDGGCLMYKQLVHMYYLGYIYMYICLLLRHWNYVVKSRQLVEGWALVENSPLLHIIFLCFFLLSNCFVLLACSTRSLIFCDNATIFPVTCVLPSSNVAVSFNISSRYSNTARYKS